MFSGYYLIGIFLLEKIISSSNILSLLPLFNYLKFISSNYLFKDGLPLLKTDTKVSQITSFYLMIYKIFVIIILFFSSSSLQTKFARWETEIPYLTFDSFLMNYLSFEHDLESRK